MDQFPWASRCSIRGLTCPSTTKRLPVPSTARADGLATSPGFWPTERTDHVPLAVSVLERRLAEKARGARSSADKVSHKPVVEPGVGATAGVVVFHVEADAGQRGVALEGVAGRTLFDVDPEGVQGGRVALDGIELGVPVGAADLNPDDVPADGVILHRVVGRTNAHIDAPSVPGGRVARHGVPVAVIVELDPDERVPVGRIALHRVSHRSEDIDADATVVAGSVVRQGVRGGPTEGDSPVSVPVGRVARNRVRVGIGTEPHAVDTVLGRGAAGHGEADGTPPMIPRLLLCLTVTWLSWLLRVC